MKKIVCGCFGTIYYARILKSGVMSDIDRVDVTDDAINAITDHLAMLDSFTKTKFSGYEIKTHDGKKLMLDLYDMDKYKLVPIKEIEHA